MGKRNYLIEGVSGTGKSSVCQELRRRGYVAIDGDRELAYQGDPTTGEKTEGFGHEHHIWDVEKVRRLAANQDDEATFFCGGFRNFKQFIDLFDEIFILDVDAETLNERLDSRPDDDWGKRKSERELILRLHATKEDVPSSGIVLDATQPLVSVVDEILSHVRASGLIPKDLNALCSYGRASAYVRRQNLLTSDVIYQFISNICITCNMHIANLLPTLAWYDLLQQRQATFRLATMRQT